MGYIAFVLDEKTRTELLRRFPPTHPDVVCHHITLQFGVSDKAAGVLAKTYGTPDCELEAIVRNDSVEAFVVLVNGRAERSDGNVYHITHSIDRSKGAKPVHSNQLVDNEEDWRYVQERLRLTGEVEYFN